MSEIIAGTVPATADATVTYYDASATDQRVAELQIRLSALEEDFSKLTAFVNSINNKIK